ncbi:MAG TPA: ATP-binding protein, partial [Bacteroidia bacterium]|nr:ATP-binding protein [Bacteroidia bacterium]
KNQQVEWERLKAEQERRRAQESEQAKQQFLANMSHEIRTPINAITGFTTLLLEKNPTEEQRKYLEIVEKSTDSLRIIINDILDLTKIEVGKMPIEKILFEPKDIVEFIANTLRPKAEAKKLELKLEYDNTIPTVLIGDPTRLNQILTNLLDNAIKFTENGSVLLKVEQADPKIKFTVTDTGIGMTPEQIDIVFEPFRQAEMGTTRKYGGTGLGLHISKQLVELQNGVLDVESTPGKGSKFSFAIEYLVSPETGTLRKRIAVSDEIIKELAGIKILLAEDNEFNRIVAIETLQLKIPGVIIDTVNNGKEAIEKFTNHDVIIMDVQMPVMDGYEATRRIRSDVSPSRNQVPIVALTASIIQTDINKCFAAGMNGFVPKPFNTNELLLALHDARKKKQVTSVIKPEKVVTANGNVTDLTFLKESCGDDAERIKKYIGMYLKQASS